MCYPTGGTIDGVRGDHVLLAPPYIVDEEHLHMIADRLETAISGSLERIKAA